MVTKTVIDNILTKCLTHAQIRSRLSSLSREERIKLLKDGDKLTKAEWMDYNMLSADDIWEIIKLEEEMEDAIEEYREDYFEDYDEYPSKIPNRVTKTYLDDIEEHEKRLDDLLFDYEKRIYTNHQISTGDNPIPKYDWNDYQHDDDGTEDYPSEIGEFFDLFYWKLNAKRDSIGDIETSLINNQNNINYTNKELTWLRQYFTDGKLPSFLTYKINGREPKQYTDDYTVENISSDGLGIETTFVEYSLTDKWKKDFNNIKNHLDNAIDKSKGLDKPTIFYHAGRIDPSLLPGDHGVWKGYKSMSFQEQVMKKHKNINDGYWNVIVLAPTGTKGVCANDERFRGYSFVDEHEYLLGRNTGYTVLDIDYDKGTEIVILDG